MNVRRVGARGPLRSCTHPFLSTYRRAGFSATVRRVAEEENEASKARPPPLPHLDPASVPCLHEMAWWPLISSVFPGGSFAVAAMQLELSAFATCGWQPSAWQDEGEHTAFSCDLAVGAQFGLSQRWASSGFYWCPWGPLQDQNVMFPIAVAQTAASSGDMVWLQSMLPGLRAVQAYLASRGLVTGNGSLPVVFTSPASGCVA